MIVYLGCLGNKNKFKESKMANINWIEIIAYILRLIADGLDKKDAINNASSKFNISKDEITRNFRK